MGLLKNISGKCNSHPALIGWICYNETYHRREVDSKVEEMLYDITKAIDPYRPVIDASGGVHYKTDMFDVHDYEQDPARLAEYLSPMLQDKKSFHSPIPRYRGSAPEYKEKYEGQPYWISEFGGMFWDPKHSLEDGWGYGTVPDEDAFARLYEKLTEVMLDHPRVCGFCYTQLTDIEQEQNGLYFYDRTPKFSQKIYDRIRAANSRVAAVEKEQVSGK